MQEVIKDNPVIEKFVAMEITEIVLVPEATRWDDI